MDNQKNNSRSSIHIALNRRRFMTYLSSIGLGSTLLPGTLIAVAQDSDEITVDMIASAEKLAGISFSNEIREKMVEDLGILRTHYNNIRELRFDQSVPPCIVFHPVPPGYEEIEPERRPIVTSSAEVTVPKSDEDLANFPVTHLGALIKTRHITSTELTKLYLARLKKYDPILHCTVTFTEELALKQAKQADEEISAGNYRGPLHGIPWGAKDLIAVKRYRTTWGAKPYVNRIIDTEATVYKRLTNAGAVLIAKLTTGALATGDRWFGGRTKNPWNTEQGSGGSSAGPGAATAAGLVAFSIGTETYGSIISPSSRCGITGLRPTFGRISRHGIMPLSWTMDKVGPMARCAEDCAIIFNAIYGPDGLDMSVIDRPFNWNPAHDVREIRVGYLKSAFEREINADEEDKKRAEERKKLDAAALEVFRASGIELIPIEIQENTAVKDIEFVRHIEGAAAFDELTLSGEIDSVIDNNRHYLFRIRRFVPGVEYIQACRVRTTLMQELHQALKDIDVYIAPGRSTGTTNYTGHPALTLPHGFVHGMPASLNIIGNLFKEAEMLAVAMAFQRVTEHHLKHPHL